MVSLSLRTLDVTEPDHSAQSLDTGATLGVVMVWTIGIVAAWTATWWFFDSVVVQTIPATLHWLWWDTAKILVWIVPLWVWVRRTDLGPGVLSGLAGGLHVRRCVVGLAVWLTLCVVGDWVLGQTRPMAQPDWITFRTVFVSPLLEELLFRGLLLSLLIRGGVSIGSASVVTAIGFVLIHLPGWSFMTGPGWDHVALAVSIGLLGIYLGLLVGRTGSVWPAYVVHAGNNAFSTGLLAALVTVR